MTVGLDLSDTPLRAVVVDDDGTVAARFEQPMTGAGLAKALKSARKAAKSDARIGVATLHPGDAVSRRPRTDAIGESGGAVIDAGGASALAESWCGAGAGLRHVATLNVGRHVTAGAIVDGQLLRGAHGIGDGRSRGSP